MIPAIEHHRRQHIKSLHAVPHSSKNFDFICRTNVNDIFFRFKLFVKCDGVFLPP